MSNRPPSPYLSLTRRFQRLSGLEDAQSVLHWDSAVVMPAGGGADRADQLAALAGVRHEMLTAPIVGEWLEQAEAQAETLDLWQRANVRAMRRMHRHAAAVPGDLVEALTRACSNCEKIWRVAKPENDFAHVAPSLKEQLTLVRQAAQAKAEALNLSPYDALLDDYSPGFFSADIDPLFADLEAFLPAFIDRALTNQSKAAPLEGSFPVPTQERLARLVMDRLGFDFNHGRLDASMHPFCGGTPGDVRITTRYDESDFLPALMGVIHETGHGLYELGLPAEWRGQPVGRALGMAVHESQSLLLEMQACRTRAFFQFAAPLFREVFNASGPAWEAEAFYQRSIRVERGFIRVDADAATYPLHVILRTRLERALIEGSLSVEDLPQAWNQSFKDLFGIPVPDDRHGCLQDIHWFDGAWGYFPSYTLGALMAAQLYDAALAAHPDIPDALAQGRVAPLLDWLRRRVHAKASCLPARDLLIQATGQPLGTAVFKARLMQRHQDSQ